MINRLQVSIDRDWYVKGLTPLPDAVGSPGPGVTGNRRVSGEVSGNCQ